MQSEICQMVKNLSNIFTPCSHLRNFRCNTELSHCLNERGHVLCAGVAFAHTHRPLSGGNSVWMGQSTPLSVHVCVTSAAVASCHQWEQQTLRYLHQDPHPASDSAFWHVSRPLVISESWRETPSASSQLAGFYFMVACGLMMES